MEIRIKIKVKDVEIELSQAEAKELRDILNDLVGKETITIYPWIYPVYPTYPQPYEITWGTGGAFPNTVTVYWSESTNGSE